MLVLMYRLDAEESNDSAATYVLLHWAQYLISRTTTRRP